MRKSMMNQKNNHPSSTMSQRSVNSMYPQSMSRLNNNTRINNQRTRRQMVRVKMAIHSCSSMSILVQVELRESLFMMETLQKH